MSNSSEDQNFQQYGLSNVSAGGDINFDSLNQTLNITNIFKGESSLAPETILKHLERKFEQHKHGWLSKRYSPDLHQVGQIETDLRLRLSDPSSQQTWLEEINQVHALLEDAWEAVSRLRRYPEFMERDDSETLMDHAKQWLTDAITEQQELEKRLLPRNSFPLPDFQEEVLPGNSPWELINITWPNRKNSSHSATADIGKQLETTLNRWNDRKVTPQFLRRFGQPSAYIGEPGAGKTHALANSVDEQFQTGKPGILIRAKEVNLNHSWESIISKAIGIPDSKSDRVLKALEETATQIENSINRNTQTSSEFQPVRALIAIDGLDETPRSSQWENKLGELVPLAKEYPKILFACSLRTTLFARINLPQGIDPVHLNESDAPLDEIFASYCNVNRIQCPLILRWALQTPLAIRLFADLYQGRHIDSVTLQEFSLAKLISRKIDNAEKLIRENDLVGWSENICPVRNTLRGIVKASLSEGELSHEKALQIAERAQKIPNLISSEQLLNILEKCRDYGLLLERKQPSDDPLEGDSIFWEPAYQTITDFLLASEAYQEAKTNLNNPEMPDYLKFRDNAIALAVYLLGMDDYDFFHTELWSNQLSTEEREELHLTTILMMSPRKGQDYRDWVIEIFKRNMPSCREVLDRLVVPGLRMPDHYYGAQFIHETLLPLQVEERDLFWSGPDFIPNNHGAPWEGIGKQVLENLEIAPDDPWDSAPLLLAWGTTTVKNESRRQIRCEIAKWSSQNPDGLLNLLKTACQTNDPQMKEDLLSVAYGASCLKRPDQNWLPICDWLIDNFFIPHAPLYTHNIVVQHNARSVIERCVACGVPIEAKCLQNVRNPNVDTKQILDIDKDAAINIDPHHGIEPATGDLAWYVVPKAIDPFFKEYVQFKNTQVNCYREKESDDKFENINETLLNQFAKGSLRKLAPVEAREAIEEVLDDRSELHCMIKIFQNATEEKQQMLLTDWGIPVEAQHQQEASPISDTNSEKDQYSPSAQAILSQHGQYYGLPDLDPNQLAFGFVSAYVAQLGWRKDIFIKEPNGGQTGEIFGADIAIVRQYPHATHGARSSTARFVEKYVWLATNELSGFLAERSVACGWGKCYDPPVNPSLLIQPTNPASDIGYGQLKLNQFFDFSGLVPDAELSEVNQVDRVNEWVKKAPLPDFKSLLIQKTDQLPEWAKNEEWMVLRAFVITRNADSQAESVLRASSFVFPADTSSLLQEDIQNRFFPPNLSDTWYEFSSGIKSVEFYRDPTEVVWAPWIQEMEGIVNHNTLGTLGDPIQVELQATTCKFYWESPNGEQERWAPAKVLREMLDIVDFREGQCLTANGQIQAFTCDISGNPWHTRRCQVLLVRRAAISEALINHNFNLGWGIWLNREPAFPLINISGRKRMFRNWHGIGLLNGDEVQVIPYSDQIEPWHRDE
ncbi:hypothetical protein PCC7418_1184 [Halothece sp. PCC 7418]|uniref:hypothetical protein n=1 Tax=Halothece sp. (strain PCC 7418) TaxID=65093 RepID=UPI0002A08D99|nr:hypothetical protein [Halothece sp. PCC 7418]AFZ43386.1 hypothetical protein PCC7418_1184 [Halothece sp. PCC 7418]